MDLWQKFRRNWLWLAAGAIFAALVAVDTYVHLRTSWDVTKQHLSNTPLPTADSPTGYAYNQRDFILPYVGMDGYHWVLQTQEMLAGAGWRVRDIDYDNAPYGREVHWSSSFRWWVAALAWLDHAYTGLPLPVAVEEVMPYANTLLVTLIILAALPMVARRFGSLATAILVFGMVAVMPVYIAFSEGKSDHHGLAVVTTMSTLLFLVAGGASWVRSPTGAPVQGTLEDWLPERAQARRWFIASGIAGGCGLWVSAASQIPVLAEVGLGALLAGGWLARGASAGAAVKPDPTLWRVWGLSGAAASIVLYLLEYFPSHFGLRLEVNHPLYALAWAAGGELLCHACRWLAGEKLALTAREWWFVAACVAIVALPLVLALGLADRTFWVADRFLWTFHEDYIAEFKSMARYIMEMAWNQRMQVVNPLLLLAIPMLFLIWRPLVASIACGLLLAGTVGTFVYHLPWAEMPNPEAWKVAGWLAVLLAEGIVLGFFAWRTRPATISQPARALLALTLLPCVCSYFVSMRQMRWMEIGYALGLVALVTVVTVLARWPEFRWTPLRRAIAAGFLASVMLITPIYTVRLWFKSNWIAPATDVEIMEIITRDVAQRLRTRLDGEVGVVVSGPTTTTWMIYWGGFKGIGTLYWENLAGLKATGDIYAAMSDEEAFALVKKHGVTHFLIFPWDEFALPYARLKNGQRLWEDPPAGAFVRKLIATGTLPRWLRPIPYQMPDNVERSANPIYIWEVAPDQTEAEARVRQAQWWSARGNNSKAFELLLGVLNVQPTDLRALIATARLAAVTNQPRLFTEALERIRAHLARADTLALDDRVDLAVVFQLARDEVQLRQQLAACIRQANAAGLRRLNIDSLYNFLTLTRQLGLAGERPGWWDFAFQLLPANGRAQVLGDAAASEQNAGRPAGSVALWRRSLTVNPDYVRALASLAWILATSPDNSLRNGREALALADKAAKLDQNQHLDVRDILACAYAECGQFDLAAEIERDLIKTADEKKAADLAKLYRERLALFQQRQPAREK